MKKHYNLILKRSASVQRIVPSPSLVMILTRMAASVLQATAGAKLKASVPVPTIAPSQARSNAEESAPTTTDVPPIKESGTRTNLGVDFVRKVAAALNTRIARKIPSAAAGPGATNLAESVLENNWHARNIDRLDKENR